MVDVKWIKIVVDIFDDDKIKLIEALPDGDGIIVCWFKLLCLAGAKNTSGVLMLNDRIAYTDEMLATIFRRPLQTVRLALETFQQFDMIEIINGAITIPNWGKHQNLDRMERLKEYQKNYQREYRKKQAQIPEQCEDDRKVYGEVHVNTPEEDIDKNKNKIKNKSVFTPPTLEEVKAYVQEKGYNVDPEKFWQYYEAGNWVDGKGNKVRNWKQKLITWAKQEKPKQYTTAAQYKPPTVIDTGLLDRIKGATL